MTSSRDYEKEYTNYGGTPKAKKDRAARNKRRREAIREHGKSALTNKDVDHKTPLRSGGSNAKSNTRLRDKSSNRSSNGHKSGEKQKKWTK